MWQDIEDLNEEEYDSLLEFSEDKSNITLRYVAALSIIANLANDLDPNLISSDENVDLSICKLIMDGSIVIDEISTSVH